MPVNPPYTVKTLKALLDTLDPDLPIVIHDADYNKNIQVDAFRGGTWVYYHNGQRTTDHCLILESLYGGIGLQVVDN